MLHHRRLDFPDFGSQVSMGTLVGVQLVIDRSKFPTADDEYTPEKRRAIDASLAESEKGPYYGPFKSGAEIAAFMKKTLPGAGPSKSNRSR
jgi:hypothetical protein